MLHCHAIVLWNHNLLVSDSLKVFVVCKCRGPCTKCSVHFNKNIKKKTRRGYNSLNSMYCWKLRGVSLTKENTDESFLYQCLLLKMKWDFALEGDVYLTNFFLLSQRWCSHKQSQVPKQGQLCDELLYWYKSKQLCCLKGVYDHFHRWGDASSGNLALLWKTLEIYHF